MTNNHDTTDSSSGFCSAPRRDRRNHRLVTLWSAIWAISFVAATLAIKKEWLVSGAAVAAGVVTALFGIATLLAYRRFLRETDELRRKIEVEALALAFGIGVVSGLTYWLLLEGGLVPGKGFGFVFAAMLLVHSVSVAIAVRRYS